MHFGQQKPKFLSLFMDWLGVDKTALNYVLDGIRNPDIWERDDIWNWKRRAQRVPTLDKSDDFRFIDHNFTRTKTYKSTDPKGKYILFGKGLS